MLNNKAISRFGFAFADREARSGSPAMQLGLAILAVMSFKIFLALQMTFDGYAALVSGLAEGGVMQQIAARFLALDEISVALAELLCVFAG